MGFLPSVFGTFAKIGKKGGIFLNSVKKFYIKPIDFEKKVCYNSDNIREPVGSRPLDNR